MIGLLRENRQSLLIQDFEHVAFTRRFLNFFPDDALRVTTEAACAGIAAGDDLEAALNAHLSPLLIERGVLDRLSQLLRSDRRVTINSSGPLLAATKAAQLNQVMAFAVLEAAKHAGRPVLGLGQSGLDRLKLHQHIMRSAEQHLALLGQHQAARVAVEQRHADIVLERAYLA